MLLDAISEAEAIFISKADELLELQNRFNYSDTFRGRNPKVSAETVTTWLAGVTHIDQTNHRRLHVGATAYYQKQLIRYNPLAVADGDYRDCLDTVLHELGHLFTHIFYKAHGHGKAWQSIGLVVGYAPVGSCAQSNRVRYPSFCSQIGKYNSQTMIGKYNTALPRAQSSVESPVARVWEICERYGYTRRRREMIQICVNEGINIHTAKTQYQKWFKENKDLVWPED